MPLLRSLAAVALTGFLLGSSGGAAAQAFNNPDGPPPVVGEVAGEATRAALQVGMDPVDDATVLLRFVCFLVDEARDGGTDDYLVEDVEWRIHVDPFECVMGHTVTAYVHVGDRATFDGEAYHPYAYADVAGRPVTVPIARDLIFAMRWDERYGSVCNDVRVQLETVLLAGRSGADLAGGASAPAVEIAAPESVASLEAPGAEASVDPQYPTPDDVAAQSEGKAAPAPDAPLPLFDLETRNEAGPAGVEASVEGASVARALGIAPGPASRERDARLAGPFAAAEPAPKLSSGRAPLPAATPAPPSDAAPSARPASPAPQPGPARVATLLAKPQTPHASPVTAVALVVASAVALALAAATLYHRLTRREIEASAPRAEIVALLVHEPGLLATQVGRRLGVHRTTAEYHLRMLQVAGAVVTRHRAWFLAGDAAVQEAEPSLAPTARAILDLARASPGVTIGDAAKAAGVDVASASRHARGLREAGLVEVRADGRFRRLFARA